MVVGIADLRQVETGTEPCKAMQIRPKIEKDRTGEFQIVAMIADQRKKVRGPMARFPS